MEKYKRFRTNISWYYVAFLLFVHPLFFINMYFNISQEKWLFFIIFSLIYTFAMFISFVIDTDSSPEVTGLFKGFGVTEYALMAFVLANIIATVLSKYPAACITGGVNGRYNGLLSIIAYFFVILLFRKYYSAGSNIMEIFAMSATLVSITAVSQYLTWDPIGMYKGVTEVSIVRMISTIGNRNIYASFLTISVPLLFYLFVTAKNLTSRIMTGVAIAISFAGGLASNSDSFYFGTGVAIIFYIFTAGVTFKGLSYIFLGLGIGGISDYTLLMIADNLRQKGYPIRVSEGVTEYLQGSPLTALLLGLICLLIFGIIYYCSHILKFEEKTVFGGKLRFPAILFIAFIMCVAIGYMISLYPFDNAMASYRGFIWNVSIRDFKDMTFIQKLFGYGPETIYTIYTEKYYDLLVQTTGVLYDNVHSEPLEYMMTSGIVGLVSYLVFIAAFFIRALKYAVKDGRIYLYMLPAIGYFSQSTVNIAQSATTPIFFVIIALGIGFMHTNEQEKEV